MSEIFLANSVQISPTSNLIGFANGNRLSIKDALSLDVVQIFVCLDKIDKFEFSSDSCYVLCALFSRNAVQVFSILDAEWKCRISEAVVGIIDSFWMKNTQNIVTECDFGIQLSIWSLTDSKSYIISNPKQSIYKSTNAQASNHTIKLNALSDNCVFFAVVHRLDLHDFIAIYSTAPNWEELIKFPCRSNDIAYIEWTPQGSHIIAAESPLTYKALIYTPTGELHGIYEAYQHALGIRSLSYQPSDTCSSPLLAIASYDSKVRLLSSRSFELACVLPLVPPAAMDSALLGTDPVCWVEVAGDTPNNSVFESRSSLRVLPHTSPDPRHPKSLPPLMGVHWMQWSPDGYFLAALEQAHPRCVWLWDLRRASLSALLVCLDPVRCCAWEPVSRGQGGRLAVCCAALHLWTPPAEDRASWTCRTVAALAAASSLQWFSAGRLLLGGREGFVICQLGDAAASEQQDAL